jgi:hypothetical protein
MVEAHRESSAAATRRLAREYGWIVPATILSIGLLTAGSWVPDPFIEQREATLRVIDAAHGELCQKLGFQTSSDHFSQCKVALLKLWEFHKEMQVSY